MERLLQENNAALHGISENFPVPGIGLVMKSICFPTGNPYTGPDDKLVSKASQLISTPSGIRDKLSEGIFISQDPKDSLRMLNDIFPDSVRADKAVSAAKKAKRPLTTDEQALVDRVNHVVDRLIQVDAFDKLGAEKYEGDDYVRPALRHTKFEHMKTAAVAVATA
jgi:acyl-CoA dehydrogenase